MVTVLGLVVRSGGRGESVVGFLPFVFLLFVFLSLNDLGMGDLGT